jgi:flagellar protein FliO/FliZ
MDSLSLLRAIGALVFTLALLFGFAILLRRYGHKLGALGMAVPGSKSKRLSVTEMLPIDARHRLVMLRRDGVEHLVILGPAGTTVVENNIAVAEPIRGVAS